MDKEAQNIYEMTNKEAAIIIGNIPIYPDDCYSVSEYQWAKGMAIEALNQKWIPMSERLPEEHEWIGTKIFGTTISDEVYVTFETPDGERFARHISFQNGKLDLADEQRMKAWSKGAKPIA